MNLEDFLYLTTKFSVMKHTPLKYSDPKELQNLELTH